MDCLPFIFVWTIVVTVTAYEIEKPITYIKEYSSLVNGTQTQSRRELEERNIFLPDPDDIPEDCKEFGICENIPNYPHELMDKLIEEAGDTINFQIESMDPRENTRRNDANKIELCHSERIDILPRAVGRKNGQYFYVVHRSSEPGSQGFVMEKCLGKRDCNGIALFENDFQPTCYQKFAKRHLTVLNTKGKFERIELDIPTCCACLSTSAYHHFYVLNKKSG